MNFSVKKTPSYCHKKFPSLKIESLSTKNQFEYKTSVFLWVYISRFHSTFLEFWVWKRNKKDFCHILLPEDMWFIITHHTNMISQREFISIKFILCWHRSKYHRIFQKILYILLGTEILTVILHKQQPWQIYNNIVLASSYPQWQYFNKKNYYKQMSIFVFIVQTS